VIEYLSVTPILDLHSFQIGHFGGSPGVRDRGALEAALARPQMTFGGDDLYPDLAAKAGALIHSLIQNRPFVDGNKRVGAHGGLVFPRVNGCRLASSPAELTDIVMAVARGELAAEALAIWIRQRLVALER